MMEVVECTAVHGNRAGWRTEVRGFRARRWSGHRSTLDEVARLDFRDQTRLFAGCESIVSILGSGLTGLVYAPPGVKVAALAPSRWSDLFFFSLMQERRAQLADIRGASAGGDPADAARVPFAIDIADLEKGLRALGQHSPA